MRLVLTISEDDAGDLLRYLDGDHHMGVHDRMQVAKQIRAQMQAEKVDPRLTYLRNVLELGPSAKLRAAVEQRIAEIEAGEST